MDAYRTPASGLNTKSQITYKPVSGILIGLCLTILLANFASAIIVAIFAAWSGTEITSEKLNLAFSQNSSALLADLLVNGVVLFFAGRFIGKRTTGKEMQYGIILSAITLLIYLPTFWLSDAFTIYPYWYNLLAFSSVILALPLGAKTVSHT